MGGGNLVNFPPESFLEEATKRKSTKWRFFRTHPWHSETYFSVEFSIDFNGLGFNITVPGHTVWIGVWKEEVWE